MDRLLLRVMFDHILTGMLPLRTDLALSVKLWPAWPPDESPVAVSGIVESVEAMFGLVWFVVFG